MRDGGDRLCKTCQTPWILDFNPRFLCGKRRKTDDNATRQCQILIHIQCGNTLRCSEPRKCTRDVISIHTSLGGKRQFCIAIMKNPTDIAIHTRICERHLIEGYGNDNPGAFQSTLSHRKRRRDNSLCQSEANVSTHAFPYGARRFGNWKRQRLNRFQSPRPRGARLPANNDPVSAFLFQSTRPVWVATNMAKAKSRGNGISIHASGNGELPAVGGHPSARPSATPIKTMPQTITAIAIYFGMLSFSLSNILDSSSETTQ